MKGKVLSFWAALVFLAIGCAGTQSVATPTSSSGSKGNAALTSAANMLTAQAIHTQVFQTIVAEITMTALAGTAVAEVPSSTPTLTQEIIQITDTPTETPTATQTEVLTPLPTLLTTDYIKKLGDPKFTDKFDTANNWYVYDEKLSKAEIKNGVMRMTIFEPQPVSLWTLTWVKAKNFYIEVTVVIQDNCSGKDRGGLMFRAPDPKAGYLFSVSCDGSYRLATWDGKTSVILADWKKSDFIEAGAEKSNTLGVMVNGNHIDLYVNRHHLKNIDDVSYSEDTRFGLLIGSDNTKNLAVEFDNFRLWRLP